MENLRDLAQSFSSSDNNQSQTNISILNSEKESANNKFFAIQETNKRYSLRIRELQEKIKDIIEKSNLVMSFLDSKSIELNQESSELESNLNAFPKTDPMVKQIEIIENYMNSKPELINRKIDDSLFHKNGLIDTNNELKELSGHVKRLLFIRKTHFSSTFNFTVMSKTAEEEDEEYIKQLIDRLEFSMKRAIKNHIKGSKKIRKEINELKTIRDRMKAV